MYLAAGEAADGDDHFGSGRCVSGDGPGFRCLRSTEESGGRGGELFVRDRRKLTTLLGDDAESRRLDRAPKKVRSINAKHHRSS